MTSEIEKLLKSHARLQSALVVWLMVDGGEIERPPNLVGQTAEALQAARHCMKQLPANT